MLLGMFWKRTTSTGAFWGLIAGMTVSFGIFLGFRLDAFGPSTAELLTFSAAPSDMTRNLWQAIWAWVVCLGVTTGLSLVTVAKPESELVGLVKGLTAEPDDAEVPLLGRPGFWAAVAMAMLVGLNVWFW